MNEPSADSVIRATRYSDFLAQQIKDGLTVTKSPDKSAELRIAGQRIFVSEEYEDEEYGHGTEIHTLVLHYYNKSVALAPKQSEQLAQAYVSRSILLKHFYKAEESLLDLERALEITQCKVYKAKIESLKLEQVEQMVCCNDVESLEEPGEKLPPPKFSPLKAIPSVASCVKMHYDDTYGRCYVATRDLKPGEVLAVEESYVAFPAVDQQYCVCSHCLRLALNAIPCDECACAIYCSERCREEALREYHNVECKVLPFFYSEKCPDINMMHNLMAARLFIKAVNKEGLEKVVREARVVEEKTEECVKGSFHTKVFSSDKFVSCCSLQSHQEVCELTEKDAFYCSIIFQCLDEYTDIFKSLENTEKIEDTKNYIKKLLVKLRRIIDVNFFYFQDFDCECSNVEMCYTICDKILGSVLTPACSFFNHSCMPNVSRVFTENKQIILFTNCPVKEGDQLFLTYGPTVGMERNQRQHILEQSYYFTCNCEACTADWPAKLPEAELEQLEWNKRAFDGIKDQELQKFYIQENIDPTKIYDGESGIYNQEMLKCYVRSLELVYEHNDGYQAHIFAKPYKAYLEKAFQKLYGLEFCIPDLCYG